MNLLNSVFCKYIHLFLFSKNNLLPFLVEIHEFSSHEIKFLHIFSFLIFCFPWLLTCLVLILFCRAVKEYEPKHMDFIYSFTVRLLQRFRVLLSHRRNPYLSQTYQHRIKLLHQGASTTHFAGIFGDTL